jgi:hypothetical protein
MKLYLLIIKNKRRKGIGERRKGIGERIRDEEEKRKDCKDMCG